MECKKSSPAKQLGNPNKSKHQYSNSVSSQRARILKHFEGCPRLSTMQARNQFGIMSPAPRIEELRKQGYRIDTQRIIEFDSNGVPHLMGLYVFQGKQEVPYEG